MGVLFGSVWSGAANAYFLWWRTIDDFLVSARNIGCPRGCCQPDGPFEPQQGRRVPCLGDAVPRELSTLGRRHLGQCELHRR